MEDRIHLVVSHYLWCRYNTFYNADRLGQIGLLPEVSKESHQQGGHHCSGLRIRDQEFQNMLKRCNHDDLCFNHHIMLALYDKCDKT